MLSPRTTSTSRIHGGDFDRLRRQSSGKFPDGVGKGVVHLTYGRLDAEKNWAIDIWHDLAAVIREFAENASSGLPEDVRARILGCLPTPTPDRSTLGVTHTSSTSTTSHLPST
jgi:hypothetical protein